MPMVCRIVGVYVDPDLQKVEHIASTAAETLEAFNVRCGVHKDLYGWIWFDLPDISSDLHSVEVVGSSSPDWRATVDVLDWVSSFESVRKVVYDMQTALRYDLSTHPPRVTPIAEIIHKHEQQ